MVNHLRKKFRTVDEAEDAYGITIDSYLAGPEEQKENQVPHAGIPEKVMDLVKKLTGCQLSMLAAHILENLTVPVLQSTYITTPRRFKCVFQKWLIPLDVVA